MQFGCNFHHGFAIDFVDVACHICNKFADVFFNLWMLVMKYFWNIASPFLYYHRSIISNSCNEWIYIERNHINGTFESYRNVFAVLAWIAKFILIYYIRLIMLIKIDMMQISLNMIITYNLRYCMHRSIMLNKSYAKWLPDYRLNVLPSNIKLVR